MTEQNGNNWPPLLVQWFTPGIISEREHKRWIKTGEDNGMWQSCQKFEWVLLTTLSLLFVCDWNLGLDLFDGNDFISHVVEYDLPNTEVKFSAIQSGSHPHWTYSIHGGSLCQYVVDNGGCAIVAFEYHDYNSIWAIETPLRKRHRRHLSAVRNQIWRGCLWFGWLCSDVSLRIMVLVQLISWWMLLSSNVTSSQDWCGSYRLLVHEVNWAGELDDGEDLEFSDDSNGKEILWSKGTTVLVNTRSSIGPVRDRGIYNIIQSGSHHSRFFDRDWSTDR